LEHGFKVHQTENGFVQFMLQCPLQNLAAMNLEET